MNNKIGFEPSDPIKAMFTCGKFWVSPQHQFLMQVLLAIFEKKAVYPLLKANPHLLNSSLGGILNNWFFAKIARANKREKKIIADVVFYFGIVLTRFSHGNLVINNKLAISAFNRALEIYNEAEYPQDWATTKNNLGLALTNLAYHSDYLVHKKKMLESAIAHYRDVLRVYDEFKHSLDWATTKKNIGNAYSELVHYHDNPKEVIECAIVHYTDALRVYNQAKYPEDWANIKSNLEKVYSNLASHAENSKNSVESVNTEDAIANYKLALKVYTRANFPKQWASTQSNLANAYENRIEGDRAKNIEDAITHYKLALRVYTRANFPEEWASTQNNLANAYRKRIRGRRARNLENAIAHYKRVLKVYTRTNFPEEWASTQNNLANAYKSRIRGNPWQNLEDAIIHYKLALEVYTSSDFPKVWASTQINLANAYKERMQGDRAENIEDAITYYKLALEVYTRTNFPEQWANTQSNLANAYKNRIQGDRAQNFEDAIAHYNLALEVYTRSNFPEQWANTQSNLANVYKERMQGDRAQNLENAIAYYKLALEVYTRADFPKEWADTQHNLAVVYNNRIQGDRAENIEYAITHYKLALEVRSRTNFPKDWASTQINLANAYKNRIRGDRAKNIEYAITHYKQALEVYTRSNFPEQWASTQNNLANAYKNRIRGNRAQNLRDAISRYKQVLQVYTHSDFPEQWASTQNNLANAYYETIKGGKGEKLEDAISLYKLVLQVFTRTNFPQQWARTKNNLASAYRKHIRGNRAQNLEDAISLCKQALEVYTRTNFPQQWAITQNNLADAYSERICGDRAQNLADAISHYKLALEVYTPDKLPYDCLRTSHKLGDLAFKEAMREIAISAYEKGIDAVEQIRSWAKTDSRRQEILLDALDVYEKAIQSCIEAGQTDRALIIAERARSRHLVELFASNDLYSRGKIPDRIRNWLSETAPELEKLWEQYNTLQAAIDAQQRQQDFSDGEKVGATTKRSGDSFKRAMQEIGNMVDQRNALRNKIRQLDPILAGQLQVPVPDITDFYPLIDRDNTALLSFYTTNADTYVLVMRRQGGNVQIQTHICPGQNRKTLQNWIWEYWFIPYSKDYIEWREFSPSILLALSKKLNLQKLSNQHLQGIEELILVPHDCLHIIPFAALPLADGSYLGDRFVLRYAPSCQILKYCHDREPINHPKKAGTVADATSDLVYARFECEIIGQILRISPKHHLAQKEATVDNYRQLAKAVNLLHSSHHASSDLSDPLQSAIHLADGKLTLGDIMSPDLRLPHLDEVFLSVCEANLGTPNPNDDLLTIGTGFLLAGARAVVSTLWSVDQLSTAIFCVFYYQFREEGYDRGLAIQKAQKELRELTGSELYRRFNKDLRRYQVQVIAQCKDELAQAIGTASEQKARQKLRSAQGYLDKLYNMEHPFESPADWAPFICQGLR